MPEEMESTGMMVGNKRQGISYADLFDHEPNDSK